jgi:hypothetical protein
MRILRAVFVACLALDLLLAGWLAWSLVADPPLVIQIRNAIFARVSETGDFFDLPPAELRQRAFRTDPPALVATWRERIPREVPYMDGVLERLAGLPEVEQVRRLVPIFSKNGGRGCGDYDDLLHQLRRLPEGEGHGCCSDHVQAFLAYASVLGIFARQVHHMQHTTAEFYVPSLGRWVWVDPQMAVFARDERGALLSLREIRARYLAGDPPALDFIGNAYHKFATRGPEDDINYDEPRDFASISMVWGNNVFEEDAFYRKAPFVPFPVRQFVGMALGVLPEARYFEDPRDEKSARMVRWQRAMRVGVPLLAAGTLAWPLALLLGHARHRRTALRPANART